MHTEVRFKIFLTAAEEEAEKLEKKDISVLADQKKELPIKQEKGMSFH